MIAAGPSQGEHSAPSRGQRGSVGCKRGGPTIGRNLVLWLAAGWAGFALLPWSAIGGAGFFGGQWLRLWPHDVRAAPAAFLLVEHGRLWLLPAALALALPALAFVPRIGNRWTSPLLIAAGCLGLASILAIALAIDITGWTWPPLATIFGALPGRQPGLGYGAL